MKHCIALLALSALIFSACDSQAPLSSDEKADEAAATSLSASKSTSESVATSSHIPQQVELNVFRVCKHYEGVVGPAVTIDFTVDEFNDGSVNVTGSVVLNNGECADLWSSPRPDIPDLVTVIEQVPNGYTVTFEKTEGQRHFLSDPIMTTVTSGTGNTASGIAQKFEPSIGTLIVFTNTFDDPPPGNEGCTPGYWKNHVSAWEVFSPDADYDATFGVDNFNPDITLLTALRTGGGGVKRLARHSTAALLSAAHAGVNYPYTVAQVIALTQAGDADALEQANELGCPL